MIGRCVKRRAEETLADPCGPNRSSRRTGTTTLVRPMGATGQTSFALDYQMAVAAAQSDPAAFIRAWIRPSRRRGCVLSSASANRIASKGAEWMMRATPEVRAVG